MKGATQKEINNLNARIARLQGKVQSLREHLHRNNSCVRLPEVARMFGVSGQTVSRMVGDGRLKGLQRAKCCAWWITKRSLKKLERDLLSEAHARGHR